MNNILPKIIKICKTYQHGLFIGLCMVLVTGIGYNIGRITSSKMTPVVTDQEASLYNSNSSESATPKKPTPTAIPKDPRVVASKAAGSKLYHYSWCSGAQRIKETNKLWFPTEADAIAAGYSLAGNCPDSY